MITTSHCKWALSTERRVQFPVVFRASAVAFRPTVGGPLAGRTGSPEEDPDPLERRSASTASFVSMASRKTRHSAASSR